MPLVTFAELTDLTGRARFSLRSDGQLRTRREAGGLELPAEWARRLPKEGC